MKKLIILFLLMVGILAIVVHSAIYIVDDQWIIQEDADQTNFTGESDNSIAYNHSAFTDGNYDTYALVNGTYYMNYSKKVDDYSSLSKWQVKYNSSGGISDTVNHSIPSDCWSQDSTKVILKVNTTFNSTSTTNAHYCYSGTWDRRGAIQDNSAVYEESMWWYVNGRTYDISYSLVSPTGTTDADYYPSSSTAINFSLNINDTNANTNHSTFNCSLYTRVNNNSADYTLNISDMVIVNNTQFNGTTGNFNDRDRIWWKWSCGDNHSRIIFNTSVRIIDIDLVYYTMSLGANKVINLSFDSGEIVTKGGVTAANLTLIDGVISSPLMNLSSSGVLTVGSGYGTGTSTGITQQLNTSGCNVTVTGGIITGKTGAGCAVS